MLLCTVNPSPHPLIINTMYQKKIPFKDRSQLRKIMETAFKNWADFSVEENFAKTVEFALSKFRMAVQINAPHNLRDSVFKDPSQEEQLWAIVSQLEKQPSLQLVKRLVTILKLICNQSLETYVAAAVGKYLLNGGKEREEGKEPDELQFIGASSIDELLYQNHFCFARIVLFFGSFKDSPQRVRAMVTYISEEAPAESSNVLEELKDDSKKVDQEYKVQAEQPPIDPDIGPDDPEWQGQGDQQEQIQTQEQQYTKQQLIKDLNQHVGTCQVCLQPNKLLSSAMCSSCFSEFQHYPPMLVCRSFIWAVFCFVMTLILMQVCGRFS